jgi:dihydrofolate reductase
VTFLPSPSDVGSKAVFHPFSAVGTTAIALISTRDEGCDVPSEVAKLKDGAGKDIQVMGSGELVQTLIRHDLVDEYRLMIHPLVLGTGKRLFRDETPSAAA